MENYKNNRHAYLIMAHHRFDILAQLLIDLDDDRNDIFLHIDKKSENFDSDKAKELVKKGNLILTRRMDIHWGGYSQIQCILMLLNEAFNYGYHEYYHFMVGVEFPLRSQDYIHNFFKNKGGYEFIGFDNDDTQYLERIKYYHVFNEYARNNSFGQKILNKVRIFGVRLQSLIGIDEIKKYDITFKKGNANWSISNNLVEYILQQENQIEKMYRHSFCGDEVFIHTLVYNSPFWDKVYDKNDEYNSSMRITTWNNSSNRFYLNDVPMLLKSGRLFARKIDGADAIETIFRIKESRDQYV